MEQAGRGRRSGPHSVAQAAVSIGLIAYLPLAALADTVGGVSTGGGPDAGAGAATAQRPAGSIGRRGTRTYRSGNAGEQKDALQSAIEDRKASHSLAACLALWEPATHMTKSEWKATCRRTLSKTTDLLSIP